MTEPWSDGGMPEVTVLVFLPPQFWCEDWYGLVGLRFPGLRYDGEVLSTKDGTILMLHDGERTDPQEVCVDVGQQLRDLLAFVDAAQQGHDDAFKLFR